jgi:sulfur relay (sulfurtransferase) DsrF/TusC family protein
MLSATHHGKHVKNILIILTQNDQSQLNVNESISALLLFASFNLSISVLFRDAALSLLQMPAQPTTPLQHFLKSGSKMVQSFEFYDIENLYILTKDQAHPLVKSSTHNLMTTQLDRAFIQQFDHIITW